MDPYSPQYEQLVQAANCESLMLFGLFCVFMISPLISRFFAWFLVRNEGEQWLAIKRQFGFLDLLWMLAGLTACAGIVLALHTGLFCEHSAIVRLAMPGVDNWFQASLRDAGLSLGDENAWSSFRGFAAAYVAIIFSVPFTVSLGIGPRAFDEIRLSSNYIVFPQKFCLPLRFRLKRLWTDISSVVVDGEAKKDKGQISLKFRSGGTLRLRRRDLPAETFNALLSAILMHAPETLTIEDLGEDGVEAPAGPNSATPHSETAVWEADYKRHYESTVFVPLPIGKALLEETYKIADYLGSTAMSATYLARTKDGERVILKELSAGNSAEGAKARELYLRESELLSKLKHPNIARVIDNFVENGRCYLVLEYIPGTDLSERTRTQGKVPEKTALEWSLQICEILEYLHSQDPPIIHRDISPDNLIIGTNQKLSLIDFGAANRFQSAATGTMIGKQSFIAPEQLRGKATTGSDIYSLGATMFTLLTGSLPEPLSVCSPRELNPLVSEETNRLIEQCTQQEAAERITSASQVKALIKEILSSSTGSVKVKLGSNATEEKLKVAISPRKYHE